MTNPPPAPTRAKVCIVCGKDCSTLDRLKDAEGRYTCKPCADLKSGRVSPDIASLYERPESRPCPQCDKPLPHDAEICVACGYNLRAGKPVKTKLGKLDPSAAGRAEAAALARRKPARWLIAGLIAGLLAAGAWTGVAYALSEPAPWMGLAAGLLVGLGIYAASREQAGIRSCCYALLLALLLGAAGKAASAILLTITLGPQHPGPITLSPDGARAVYAREVAKEITDAGRQLYWPAGFSLDNAKAQEHFPPEVWQDTSTRWDANGPGWQQQYRSATEERLQLEADEKFSTDRLDAFTAHFDWWDAIYAGIGLALAAALGAGVLNLIGKS